MQAFSHDGGKGLQRFFAGGDEGVIKGFGIGLMAHSYQRWHIQSRSQILIAGFSNRARAMNGLTRCMWPGMDSSRWKSARRCGTDKTTVTASFSNILVS